MPNTASTSGCGERAGDRTCGLPRPAVEIIGIILALIWFWPLAVTYIVWKLMGYPVPNEFVAFMERNFTWLRSGPSAPRAAERGAATGSDTAQAPAGPTGNRHFDAYRRSELERLEAERQRLDDEAQAFSAFVEELKRAKDREQFDAYMRKHRGMSPAAGD